MELFKTKVCKACGAEKPRTVEFFNKNEGGFRSKCRECTRSAKRQQYSNRPALPRSGDRPQDYRWYFHGLTAEQRQKLREDQGHVCPICVQVLGEKVCVDHDHHTGHVRGLICYTCNTALGMFKDSAENISRALQYLAAAKAKENSMPKGSKRREVRAYARRTG